jgi:hypothetical protein
MMSHCLYHQDVSWFHLSTCATYHDEAKVQGGKLIRLQRNVTRVGDQHDHLPTGFADIRISQAVFSFREEDSFGHVPSSFD